MNEFVNCSGRQSAVDVVEAVGKPIKIAQQYRETFEQHNEIRRIGEATYSIYNPYSQFSEKAIKQQTNNKRQQRN